MNRGSIGGVTTSNNWMYNNPDLVDSIDDPFINTKGYFEDYHQDEVDDGCDEQQ